MKSYAEEHGIMKTPRRSLIGSMFGNNILLYIHSPAPMVSEPWVSSYKTLSVRGV